MKTYTIVATDTREKLDNTYLSLQLVMIPEADIEVSYDSGVTSAVLKAGVGLGLSLINPILYVKGTEAKTISIYNGAFQKLFYSDIFGTDADHTEFEADGTMKMIGAATVYNDLQYSITSAKVPASNAPTRSTFNTSFNEYTFAIDDYIDLGSQEIPHNYKEGTDLEIHLHWATNGTNVDARGVKRQVEYCWALMDGISPFTQVFTAPATLSAETTLQADVTTLSHIYTSIGVITGTNVKIGSQLKMRLKRIAATGTAPTGNPFGLQLGVHYQADTLGSRTVSSK